jgi:hypothetical protein
MEQSPIACDLVNLNEQEKARREELVGDLRGAMIEHHELPQGIAFAFESKASTLVDLVEFIAFERVCCPFLNFDLKVPENNGTIRLRITGREGVKEYVATELRMQDVPTE